MIKHLKPFGYSPSKHVPNIWAHETCSTKFWLYVDDFRVTFFSQDDANRIIEALHNNNNNNTMIC